MEFAGRGRREEASECITRGEQGARLRSSSHSPYRPHVPLATSTLRENWEVSPILVLVAVPLVLVAVMVTLSPTAGISEVHAKGGESPLASVVVVT